MSRKDYQLIAYRLALLAKQAPTKRDKNIVLCVVASALADTLAMDNPRFDKDRFIEACNA